MKRFTILLLVIFSIPLVLAAFPRPVGYVNDFANILPDRAEYEQGLIDYEKNTTVEVAVVTLDSLPPDQTLATYAVELFQDWGIGKKGEDNGLLILIVKNGTVGNRLRIEVGYGLQGYITGAEAGRILDDALPYYVQGDYQTALDTILYELPDQLTDYVPGQQPQKYVIGPWEDFALNVLSWLFLSNWTIGIFIVVFIVSIIMSSRCPYCFGPLKCSGDECTCKKCGRKITRRKRYAPVLIGGGSVGGGGGFGGFGGGGSGGGGAGR